MNKSRLSVVPRPILSWVSLALAGIVLAVIGLALLSAEVVDGDTLALDRAILLTINQTASPAQDIFWTTITHLGDYVAVLAAMAIVAVGLFKVGRINKVILLSSSVGGAILSGVVLKLVFSRARPELWPHLVAEMSYSFPSGHAIASSALAISLIVILWSSRWRYLVLASGLLYIVLVGYSRLYLGVHYPTDILAGWAVSLAWVLFVTSLYYRHAKNLKT